MRKNIKVVGASKVENRVTLWQSQSLSEEMNRISETTVVHLGTLFEKGCFSVLTGASHRHRIGATCPRGSPMSFATL